MFLSVKGPQYHAKYIRNKVGDKVVTIYGKKSGGTGFHVVGASGKTYIATNGHICLLANDKDQVWVRKGNIGMYRNVVYRHPNHDLCLVEALPGYEGLNVGGYPELGEVVALVGHPGLRPLSLARGEIIGNRSINLIYAVNAKKEFCIGEHYDVEQLAKKPKLTNEEIDAIFFMLIRGYDTMCYARHLRSKMLNGISYGGNSGSPVVNFWGQVNGVLYAGGRHVTDSYVVPLYYLKSMLKAF